MTNKAIQASRRLRAHAAARLGGERRPGRGAARAVLLCGLLALLPPAWAQDSFGSGTEATRPASSPGPVPRTSPAAPAPQDASGETRDFGVAPTSGLRPSDQLGGPTPTSIPGGRVITTPELWSLLQRGQGQVLLLHAYGSMQHLPGAIAVVPASQGGSFDDEVQRGFGQYLQQATGGDLSRMLVLYCGGVQCWGSYNAALRAIRLGYRNVHWYRGGLQAWQEAGLPLGQVDAQAPGR